MKHYPARTVFRPYFPMMGINDMAADGQSQPCAARSRFCHAALGEGAEYRFQLARRNADALIGDAADQP